MKKDECNTENCERNNGKKKKIAIGAALASVAALVGVGAIIKKRKAKKSKQAK